MKYLSNFVISLALLTMLSSDLRAEDSTQVKMTYKTIGFQLSLVSGTGISYGDFIDEKYRVRGTFGILTTDNDTKYAYGVDVHYIINQNEHFSVFLGPSIGNVGGKTEKTKTRIALATGIEAPITGKWSYKNICAGLILYYPTLYTFSGNINVTGGFYISYNF